MYSFRRFFIQYFMIAAIFSKHKNMVNGFGMNLIKVPDDDVSQVVCSMALLRKYYNSGEALSGSVLYMSLTTASIHTQKKLLEAIHTIGDYPWSVVIRDPKNLKLSPDSKTVLHEKPQCYFVIIENLEDEDLEDIFEDWKITVNWNPLAQFVVYLASVEETDEEMTELMIEILLSFMNKKIYNVNVIGQSEENGYYYGKTVFPYHPDNNCGNRVISIETLDVCDYHIGERTENNGDEDADSFGENDDGDGYENEGGGDYGGEVDENNDNGAGDGGGDEENGGNDTDGLEENEKNDNDNGTENNADDDEKVEKEENNNDGAGVNENDHGADDDGNNEENGDNNNDGDNKDENTNNEPNDVGNNEDNGDGEARDTNTEVGNDDQETENNNNDGDGGNTDQAPNYEDHNQEVNENKEEYEQKDKNIVENNDASVESYNLADKNFEIHFQISYNRRKNKGGKSNIKHKNERIKDTKNEDKPRNLKRYVKATKKPTKALKYIDESLIKPGEYNTETFSRNKNDHRKFKHKINGDIRKGKYNAFFKNKPQKAFTKYKTPIHNMNKNRQRPSSNQNPLVNEFKETQSTFPKFMRQETDYNTDDDENSSSNQTKAEPHLYFEEMFRALFLDKFPKDLSGCPLAAAYRPWEPYIFSDVKETVHDDNITEELPQENNGYENDPTFPDENGENFLVTGLDDYDSDLPPSKGDDRGIELSGIEYQLLQTIGERLHINIDLQIENTNLYHLFQQLIDGDIEMVIGGIDEDPSMSQYVSSTIPYHQDDLTWCVAKARRSHSLFNFVASFSLIVWLVSFIYMLVAAITITYIKRFLKVRLRHLNGFFSILFRVFSILFNQSIPVVVKQRPLRFAFASTFFLALILVNAYQSFLISTLTNPKSAYQISSVEEIYENRMIIKGSVENVRHLNKEGEIFKYIREKFQMCYNIEECLMEAADNDNIAVTVSRQHSFYNPRIPRSRLYCFDRNENLYVYLVTMLLPKKFHLLHKINPVIQHVIESGHMQKWARDLDMRRRILEERNHVHEDAFRSLTLSQVVGTFVFTGALLCIAILSFTLECWVYRLSTKRRRTRLKIIRCLHRRFLRV